MFGRALKAALTACALSALLPGSLPTFTSAVSGIASARPVSASAGDEPSSASAGRATGLPVAAVPDQTPPNDDLSNATVVDVLPFSAAGTAIGATAEPAEVPDDCGFAEEQLGVWYRIDIEVATSLLLDTAGTDEEYDTVLSVWTGASHPLQPVTCNDDEPGGKLWSRLVLTTEPGVEYLVRVMGLGGEVGDFVLNVRELDPPMQNDDLADEVVISALPYAQVALVPELSEEADEAPPSCGSGAPGAWYRYAAGSDERLALYGSAYGEAVEISVWSGVAHPLTELMCAEYTGASSPLLVDVPAGTTVHFRVAPYPYDEPDALLVFDVIRAPEAPANDDPEAATEIDGLPFETVQDATWATSSAREAAASCVAESSGGVWFRLRPEASARVAFHAFLSEYDVVLSLWRFEPGGSMTELGCRTGGLIDGGPLLVADVAAGDELYLLADGSFGRGTLQLAAYIVEIPDGDALADAGDIGGLPYTGTATPHYATAEVGEVAASCHFPEFDRGVWYRLVPSASDRIMVSSTGESAVLMTLWAGGPGFPLTEVACAATPQRPVIADVQAGQTYYLRASAPWLDPTLPVTPVAFSVTEAPERPTNDTQDNPKLIGSLPFEETTSLLGAAPDPGTLVGTCEPVVGATVALWYRLSALEDARVEFRATADNITVVSVWREGNEPLTEVACAVGAAVADIQAGSSYLIRAASPLGPLVGVTFSAVAAIPPANDDLAGAIEVASLPFTDAQTTIAASDESGESESECTGLPENGVWYAYTAPDDVRIAIDTQGSSEEFDTVLSVWTGEAQAYPLVPVTCNDDSGESLQSRIDLDLTAGDRIYVRAGGLGGAVGPLRLNVSEIGRPPENDDLDRAIVVSPPDGFSDRRSTLWASTESEEVPSTCLPVGGDLRDRTVWYRLDATDDLNVTLSTAGSEFDTVLSVWTGGPAHPLGELACNDNVGGAGTTASELSFSAVAGRTYYVQVVGVAWAGGDLTFGSRAATLGSTTWTIYLNHLLTRRR